jgi:hypothetical protein
MMVNHMLRAAPAAAPASTSTPISTIAAATPRTLWNMNRSWNRRRQGQNWCKGGDARNGAGDGWSMDRDVRGGSESTWRKYDMFVGRG